MVQHVNQVDQVIYVFVKQVILEPLVQYVNNLFLILPSANNP